METEQHQEAPLARSLNNIGESPLLKLLFPVVATFLLGWIANSASAINAAQVKQGESLSELKGSIAVMTQQNSETAARLNKVEFGVDENRKSLGLLSGRVLVLESIRRK